MEIGDPEKFGLEAMSQIKVHDRRDGMHTV